MRPVDQAFDREAVAQRSHNGGELLRGEVGAQPLALEHFAYSLGAADAEVGNPFTELPSEEVVARGADYELKKQKIPATVKRNFAGHPRGHPVRRTRDDSFDSLDALVKVGVEEGKEKIFLRREVMIDRTLADAGSRSDLSEARGIETPLCDDPFRGPQQIGPRNRGSLGLASLC